MYFHRVVPHLKSKNLCKTIFNKTPTKGIHSGHLPVQRIGQNPALIVTSTREVARERS